MSLENRLALITGGSRGIGKGIALALAADGADIAINYVRDENAAAETVEEIRKIGRKANAYQAAVQNYEEDAEMVARINAEMGPVGILVNNAGIASKGKSVVDTDPSEVARVISIHACSAHYLSALCLPSMRTQARGDVVMISSVATKSLSANGAPYNMAKAALEALAATLYKEEVGNNIHVNVVAPGLVETEMGKRLARATQGVEDMRTLDRNMPFGRVCQPEDIANVVRFLVSEYGSYVTGERLYVNGGA